MGKKKKFLEKKKSATFQLIARDSSDPNYDDGPSGDRVFVRVDNNPFSVDTFFDESHEAVSDDCQFAANDPNLIFADAPDDEDDGDGCDRVSGNLIRTLTASGPVGLPDNVRREILELGFPDDGYNYLLHLREIKNTGGGSTYYHNSKAKPEPLPNDVKAYDASRVPISEVSGDPSEKSIYSVASKTIGVRIQKAVDPEVTALLDDSDLSRFGSDIEDLEEDFVVKANLPEQVGDVEFDTKLSLEDESELSKKELSNSKTSLPREKLLDFDDVVEARKHLPDAREADVGEKPRVRRLLDERFDLLELQEYGTESTDSEDEYNGSIAEENESHEPISEKVNLVLLDRAMFNSELDDKYRVPADCLHGSTNVISRCMEYAEKYENDNQEDVIIVEESSDESKVWDCETIVSTYSNLDNHYGKIEAPGIRRKKKLAEAVSGALSATSPVISLKGKEKLPVDFLPRGRKSTVENTDVSGLRTKPQKRKQHGQESKEEKKERKAAVKEERREACRVKKEIKGLYRCEIHRAQKVAAYTGPPSIHLM